MGDSRRIGPYRLSGEIGRGGFSTVHLAFRRGGEPVAVKVLEVASGERAARESFGRELGAIERLADDQHIVPLVDDGRTDDGRPYLVMPYYPGGSLADRVREEGPLDVAPALTVAVGLAAALQHAHDQGVLHRDIKPSNVLFDESGRARLGDFGLSHIGEAAEMTLAGTWATPAYLPPELVDGAAATAVTDIYSLGATIHFMLAGTPPYGSRENVYLQLSAIRSDPPPRLRRDDLPVELVDLVAATLEKDPARRPDSAGALCARLSDIAEEYGFALDPVASDRAVGRPRPPRRRLVVLTAAAVVAVAAVFGVVAMASDDPAELAADVPAGAEVAGAAAGVDADGIELEVVTDAQPGLQPGWDRPDIEVTSAELDKVVDRLVGLGSLPGDRAPTEVPGVGRAPAQFDYYFVNRFVNEHCTMRMGTDLVLRGASAWLWPAAFGHVVLGQFESADDARNYLTGFSLERGAHPDECANWDASTDGSDPFAGVEISYQDRPLDVGGYDQLNLRVGAADGFPGLDQHLALGRIGDTVVIARIGGAPGVDRTEDLSQIMNALRDGIEAMS